MVTLSTALTSVIGAATPYIVPLHETHALLLEVTDAVGTVRDAVHLQHCLYLGQEFRVIGGRRYWFAPDESTAGLPYSLILADHARELLDWGLLQSTELSDDAAGPVIRARIDRTAMDLPQVEIGPQIDVLTGLGAEETAVLAGAVFRLSHQGRHPGHPRFSNDLRPAVRAALAQEQMVSDEGRLDRICTTGLQLRSVDVASLPGARAS